MSKEAHKVGTHTKISFWTVSQFYKEAHKVGTHTKISFWTVSLFYIHPRCVNEFEVK